MSRYSLDKRTSPRKFCRPIQQFFYRVDLCRRILYKSYNFFGPYLCMTNNLALLAQGCFVGTLLDYLHKRYHLSCPYMFHTVVGFVWFLYIASKYVPLVFPITHEFWRLRPQSLLYLGSPAKLRHHEQNQTGSYQISFYFSLELKIEGCTKQLKGAGGVSHRGRRTPPA